jgi:hypothetical protein
MIKISKIEQLLKNLEDLERDLEAGKIPKKQYTSLKKQYTNRLETLQAAERIKRMQGRSTSENTLDHWASKSKIEKDKEEQEELIKKYVTTPKPTRTQAKAASSASSSKGGISRIGIIAGVLLALAFFIGTGFGVMMLNTPVTVDNGTVMVNQSAFPLIENLTTNTTKSNTTISNTTIKNNTNSNTNSNTNKTNSGGSNNSGGNTGGNGGKSTNSTTP